ncbi:PAS domain-containing sensor histidine kinase [Rhizobium leguminosarum]|uniref:PAS domain-containing sensor histidine kinase n=1 Tax=Rhizobium leguminosarum TaxID=384 RepID=UPI0010312574|nr:PAS domain-containing sensor histidine kinase [Rhizobium leguminosarum]TAU83236.1 PAS domain S-box protein [Rhizobium leguminosarum]
MNEVLHAETRRTSQIEGAEGGDIEYFLALALQAAAADRGFIVTVADEGLFVQSYATEDGFSSVSVPAAVRELDENVILKVLGSGRAMTSSNGRRSILCVPLPVLDGSQAAVYLETEGEVVRGKRLETLQWLASTFATSLAKRNTDEELRSVKEEAARVERELRLNLDMIPALSWIGGPGGELQEASSQWHAYTGISREDALGMGFLASFHPDDVQKVITAWTELLGEGKPGGVEARMLRYDGQARYFMLRAVPLIGDDGKVRKWYGINTDIDDLKRTEFELAKSKAVMAEAQRIIETGSWSWDMMSDVFTCSAECTNIVGLPNTEITFETLIERVHPEDREMVAAAHGRALQGEELNVQHRFILPDGTVKFIHARGRLIYERSHPRAYIGTIVDITEATRSEERIRSSLAQAQRAQASLAEAQMLSHVGSFYMKPSTGESIWSAETCNMFRFDPAQPLTHEMVMTRVHPDDRERIERKLQKAIFDREPWEAEFRLLMPDGSIKHVHCMTRVETDPEQEPEVFGAIIDLTDRVNGEEALRKAQADVVRMNRLTAMGAVTVSIAHEMNQPLMAIVTNAATCLSWLDRPEPDIEEAKIAAERIVKEGRRAGDVLLNVRNMARNSRPSIATVDINEVVGDVLTMMRSELRSRHINTSVSLSPTVGTVHGDKVQLQQVLLNLMLNAAEAMTGTEHGRTIDVTSVDRGSHLLVKVEDNGHGLDPIATERIFEAFFSTKTEGTGMGLAICRSIIEAHSGTLSARPRASGGSVFEFAIPYAKGGV